MRIKSIFTHLLDDWKLLSSITCRILAICVVIKAQNWYSGRKQYRVKSVMLIVSCMYHIELLFFSHELNLNLRSFTRFCLNKDFPKNPCFKWILQFAIYMQNLHTLWLEISTCITRDNPDIKITVQVRLRRSLLASIVWWHKSISGLPY